MPPGSKEIKPGSNNQVASLSAGKNTGIVLVPGRAWKRVPTAIFDSVDISEVPECHLLQQISSQWGWQNYFKDWYLVNLQPAFLFLTYF